MEDVYLYHSMFNADYRKARDELSKSEVKYKYISYKTLGKILRNKKTITNRGIIIKGCKKRIKLKLKLKYDEYFTIKILTKSIYHTYCLLNDLIFLLNLHYCNKKHMNMDVENIKIREEYFQCKRKKDGSFQKRIIMDYIPVKKILEMYFNKKYPVSLHSKLLSIPENIEC